MAQTRRITAGIIAGTTLALIGAAVGIVPLFWRGWAHVRVTFATQGPSGAQVFRRLGIDVDRPIAAITEGEINRAIPPTLWQVHGHPFPIVTALLLLAALLALMAVVTRRGQRFVSGIALLASIAAAVITAVAFIQVRARFDALPDTIDAAIRASGVLSQVVGYTTGRPQISGGAAWPVIMSAAGVGVTLAGTALAFVGSLRAARSPALLPRFRGQEGRRKQKAHGDAGRPTSVSDD